MEHQCTARAQSGQVRLIMRFESLDGLDGNTDMTRGIWDSLETFAQDNVTGAIKVFRIPDIVYKTDEISSGVDNYLQSRNVKPNFHFARNSITQRHDLPDSFWCLGPLEPNPKE